MKMTGFRLDFVGVGAPKCATTWLTFCLQEHPEICLPKLNTVNELNYFSHSRGNNSASEYEQRGIEGYKQAFQNCDFNDPRKKIGEMSTHYLVDTSVATVLRKQFPKTKIIISLRNPTERAFSEYLMHKHFALTERASFAEAFAASKTKRFPLNYKAKSMYYDQIRTYLATFPKNQVKIILVDDIKNDPKKVMRELYDFLGVDSSFEPPSLNLKVNESLQTKSSMLRKGINALAQTAQRLERAGLGSVISRAKRTLRLDILIPKIHEKNTTAVQKEQLDDTTRKQITKEFIKDIEKLEKLIKRDLSAWK